MQPKTRLTYEFTPPEGTQVSLEVEGPILRLVLALPEQDTHAEEIAQTTGYMQVLPDTAPAFVGMDAFKTANVLVQTLYPMGYDRALHGVDPEVLRSLFTAAARTVADLSGGLDIHLQETVAACRLLVMYGRNGSPCCANALAVLEAPLLALGISQAAIYGDMPISLSTTLADLKG